MAQGILPFKYELERETQGFTSLAGLPVYLELARKMSLAKSLGNHLKVRTKGQGWSDSQIVTSLILLNLAGGDSVEDINLLEADEGLCQVVRRAEMHGLSRKERRVQERRWRKKKLRTFPSPSAIFRYLSAFHDPKQGKLRVPGKAFIPASNEHLKGFVQANKDILSFHQENHVHETATLDMDATLVATNKADALYCYKGFSAYQPLNTWWAEKEMVVHTEFRDGNVPAGFEQLRVFKEALSCLPESVKKVRLRSDTAGYQHDLLKYCAKGLNKRFGKIEFAIGCDVTPEFKKAVAEISESDWHPLYKKLDGKEIKTDTEWAEVCFVPNVICHSNKDPVYRYLVKRTSVARQRSLPGMKQDALPFPNMEMKKGHYKIFGVVTNMDMDGGDLINWQHQRCGKSEEAHSIMKEDLAGGKLPSGDFGENAAWWWIMILAFNLNTALKSLAMGDSWVKRRMKAIRFHVITIPARILDRSRKLLIRLSHNHPSFELFLSIRQKLSLLVPVPDG